MKSMKSTLSLLLAFFWGLTTMAQTTEPEMADAMRSEGKIYVVVAIILIILAGLFYYLFRLDQKISQFENSGEKKA